MVVVLIAADALSAPHVQTIQDALGADNPPLLLVGAEVHSSLRPWI